MITSNSMSDSEKEKFEILEREFEELYLKESRERKHWRYLHMEFNRDNFIVFQLLLKENFIDFLVH